MGFFDTGADFLGDLAKTIGGLEGDGGSVIGDVAKELGPDAFKIGTDFSGGLKDIVGQVGDVTPGGGGDWWSQLLQGTGENSGKAWGGVKEGWKDFAGFAKDALPFASLGASGLGMASSIRGAQQAAEQNKILKHSQELQERAAVPLTNFGETTLRQAAGGNVPPAVQAQIDQWAQGARQLVRDHLARAGIPESQARVMEESWINQTAQAMKAQWLQGQEQIGVEALRSGAGAGAQIQQGAAQQQGGIESLIKQANEALAKMAAA